MLANCFSSFVVIPNNVNKYTIITIGIVSLPIGILVIAITLNNVTCAITEINSTFNKVLIVPNLLHLINLIFYILSSYMLKL